MPMRPPIVTVAPRKVSAIKAFPMPGGWRLATWGAAAAAALLFALLAGWSEIGAQRAAAHSSPNAEPVAVASPQRATPATPTATPPLDAQAETRRLAEAVRGLKADDEEIKSRLCRVERNIDDLTGSVARQIEAAKSVVGTSSSRSWADDTAPVLATPAVVPPEVAPVVPHPASLAAPVPDPMTNQLMTPVQGRSETVATAAPTQYGVDIGGALSIETLNARWAAIRFAHPQLFAGLQPVVALKQIAPAKRMELRLVAGPLRSADAAAQLCAALAPFRLFCEPTHFAGQRLALH
ncbi:MAG TPA: hypothetical protein VGJ20_44915 [Xanthobacteraceae bacterium]